ncbi:MAG TPA: hypothetical protein VFB41_00830, partial [Solirubrobacteraceae bacterium]|nr:hypothetical protein [Solirubrobacteraceae bacterium]
MRFARETFAVAVVRFAAAGAFAAAGFVRLVVDGFAAPALDVAAFFAAVVLAAAFFAVAARAELGFGFVAAARPAAVRLVDAWAFDAPGRRRGVVGGVAGALAWSASAWSSDSSCLPPRRRSRCAS